MRADGFSLQLSGPSVVVAGQPVTLTASGKNPALADYPYPTYLDVDVLRPSAVSTCPASNAAAGQLTTATGGALLAYDVPIDIEPDGNFSILVGLTPAVPGPALLCGYTAGLAGETLATASLTVTVQNSPSPIPAPGSPAPGSPAPGSPAPRGPAPGRPAVVAAPRLTRSGNRLRCGTGSWSNVPSRFSYRWLVGGKAKRGATGRTLLITPTLRGHKVQCAVTASNSTGRATAFSQRLAIR
jgi:hypothetical protein